MALRSNNKFQTLKNLIIVKRKTADDHGKRMLSILEKWLLSRDTVLLSFKDVTTALHWLQQSPIKESIEPYITDLFEEQLRRLGNANPDYMTVTDTLHFFQEFSQIYKASHLISAQVKAKFKTDINDALRQQCEKRLSFLQTQYERLGVKAGLQNIETMDSFAAKAVSQERLSTLTRLNKKIKQAEDRLADNSPSYWHGKYTDPESNRELDRQKMMDNKAERDRLLSNDLIVNPHLLPLVIGLTGMHYNLQNELKQTKQADQKRLVDMMRIAEKTCHVVESNQSHLPDITRANIANIFSNQMAAQLRFIEQQALVVRNNFGNPSIQDKEYEKLDKELPELIKLISAPLATAIGIKTDEKRAWLQDVLTQALSTACKRSVFNLTLGDLKIMCFNIAIEYDTQQNINAIAEELSCHELAQFAFASLPAKKHIKTHPATHALLSVVERACERYAKKHHVEDKNVLMRVKQATRQAVLHDLTESDQQLDDQAIKTTIAKTFLKFNCEARLEQAHLYKKEVEISRFGRLLDNPVTMLLTGLISGIMGAIAGIFYYGHKVAITHERNVVGVAGAGLGFFQGMAQGAAYGASIMGSTFAMKGVDCSRDWPDFIELMEGRRPSYQPNDLDKASSQLRAYRQTERAYLSEKIADSVTAGVDARKARL